MKRVGLLLLATLVATTLALLANAGGTPPARGEGWITKPTTGIGGRQIGPEGFDGQCDTQDDYDGIHNSPDLRGPDGICGTADDLHLWWGGTGEPGGRPGCFVDDTENCAHEAGAKTAMWSWKALFFDRNCLVRYTVTNTSVPDLVSGQPYRGCICRFSSPHLPNLEAAVRERIASRDPAGILPGESVTAVDGPGSMNGTRACGVAYTTISVGWNPDEDPEPAVFPVYSVGGITEILVDSSDSPARAAEGAGSSGPPYGAIAGGLAAAAVALAAGGWYARRRLS